ncbi:MULTISPECIES: gamma-glutamylcyclotransferase family protein [unclassified Tenacibaculum]|uniref:gamma-glutamylcyclotransferase family protein n=1 Tax=unclassified Tenacibaculum TaxID=2635139 RepID=UPI001F170622|nr:MULTISPECIES: gamma-glutamylcyclotransferase family protein [unclassified Tenacibaculum]MCF2874061.1 gamma-glutamylcyclotransferase [Tenacibaculum sp. Cn5-1]MCF2934642.1 gamma-glutamylcyclotransferase [Tenacibaculum sp. Cn5-34]MCG7510852.1 gamma-glutamylcyclotransferase [Tenacibaculum sp. Cn5-46]
MEKLFVYGTLGPEKPNEHILKDIGGKWKEGYVLGKLYEEGWGADVGFPGIRLENKIEKVDGYVFYSNKLEDNWDELDKFEGQAYKRVKTTITIKETGEEVEAYIYSLK